LDAIQMIKKDHREVEQLFAGFERAERAEDLTRQQELAQAIVRELSLHASIEEQLLYPALRRAGVEAETLDALEEHHAVKVTLDELDAMSARDERFAPKLHVVVEAVRRHVEEEERQLLPHLEAALEPDELRALGDALVRARGVAPTRPHPFAPDTPPGVFVAGAAAAVYDRARDALRDAAALLRGIVARAVDGFIRGARAAGERAGEQGRAAIAEARERGRETVREARERGAEAAEQVAQRGRAVTGRVEATARVAARSARRSARQTARAAKANANGVHRPVH
jgi:hemerythrin-like domain-containing protein